MWRPSFFLPSGYPEKAVPAVGPEPQVVVWIKPIPSIAMKAEPSGRVRSSKDRKCFSTTLSGMDLRIELIGNSKWQIVVSSIWHCLTHEKTSRGAALSGNSNRFYRVTPRAFDAKGNYLKIRMNYWASLNSPSTIYLLICWNTSTPNRDLQIIRSWKSFSTACEYAGVWTWCVSLECGVCLEQPSVMTSILWYPKLHNYSGWYLYWI